jgi:hypothetical protein
MGPADTLAALVLSALAGWCLLLTLLVRVSPSWRDVVDIAAVAAIAAAVVGPLLGIG